MTDYCLICEQPIATFDLPGPPRAIDALEFSSETVVTGHFAVYICLHRLQTKARSGLVDRVTVEPVRIHKTPWNPPEKS